MPIQQNDPKTRQRLSADARRNQILEAAISIFAAGGFDASTRDIARAAGISQSLVFNYFPTKEDLLHAVYVRVYLDRWRPEWEHLLTNRKLPFEYRLITFYTSYVETIFEPDRMRLHLHAGLRSLDVNKWYISLVEERVIKRICRELCYHYAPQQNQAEEFSQDLVEAVWTLHSGLFFHVVRRELFNFERKISMDRIIAGSVQMLLSGARGLVSDTDADDLAS